MKNYKQDNVYCLNGVEDGYKVTTAKYWVVESGADCDGFYTRGKVRAFADLDSAIAYEDAQHEWSDGMGYHIIEDYTILEEYCDDHNLIAKNYCYVSL